MNTRRVTLGAACMFGACPQCKASECECPCHRPKTTVTSVHANLVKSGLVDKAVPKHPKPLRSKDD